MCASFGPGASRLPTATATTPSPPFASPVAANPHQCHDSEAKCSESEASSPVHHPPPPKPTPAGLSVSKPLKHRDAPTPAFSANPGLRLSLPPAPHSQSPPPKLLNSSLLPPPAASSHNRSQSADFRRSGSPPVSSTQSHLMRRFNKAHSSSSGDLLPLSPLGLAEMLEKPALKLVLIDIRPFTMYAFTHIRGAISICIPSTLLKRQTFGFSRILEFVAPQDVKTLQQVAGVDCLVFYDQSTAQCTADSSLQRTATKFLHAHPALHAKTWFLSGGLVSVAKTVPELIEAGDDLISAAQENSARNSELGKPDSEWEAPRLTLSSVKAAPKSPFSLLPVLTGLDPLLGSPMHTPSRAKPPLDDSTRLLAEGEVAQRLPEFPPWLIHAVNRTVSGQNVLAEAFQRLQAAELRRMSASSSPQHVQSAPPLKSNQSVPNQRLLSPRFKLQSPRTPHTPLATTPLTNSAHTNSAHTNSAYTNSAHTNSAYTGSPPACSAASLSSTEPSPTQQYVIVAGDDPRKNRYTNIAPYMHNRVIVRGSEYLNASYIESSISPLKYIATQAPVPAAFGDFWWCCWEQRVPLIVMLTTLRTESGQVKGHKYWFDSSYDGLQVRLVSEKFRGVGDSSAGMVLRQIELTLGSESRLIDQIQYENWPDLGCPADPSEVLEVIELKKALLKNANRSAHIVVHCSAGCGRTGTFCAVDSVTDYLDHLSWEDARSDEHDRVQEVVSEFRKQRIAMVQNQRQLLLCYQAVMLWYLRSLERHHH